MKTPRHLAVSLGLCLAVAACTPAVDRAALAAVQVSADREAPSGCRLIGPLEAVDDNRWVPGGPRIETAMLHLREKAVLAGGNRLQVDAIVPPNDGAYNPAFIVRARLYSCVATALPASDAGAPPPSASGASSSVTPQRVCEPECSPGFTCLRGTCVSACNPACAASERCGTDRICHPIAAVPPPSAVPQ